MKKKVIIFGASLYGEIAYNILKNEYDIIGFADNDTKKWEQTFNGMKVFSPKRLNFMENIEVIIASQYYSDIGRQLEKLKVANIQIFFYLGDLKKSETYNADYKLVTFNTETFFKGVKIDKNKVKDIQNNFSLNYNHKNTKSLEKKNKIRKDKKKVLFCAYYFPPLGLGGTQRSLKFVKHLRTFGYEPIVITVGKDAGNYSRDDSMLQEVPSDIEIIRFDDMLNSAIELTDEEQQQIMNLYVGLNVSMDWINKYLGMVRGTDIDYSTDVLIPEKCMNWVNSVLMNIEKKVDMEEVELVYTTLNPFSTSFIGYYIKQKYNIPWVIDYRDPWTTNENLARDRHRYKHEVFLLLRELEQIFAEEANHILVVAEGMKQELAETLNVSKEKITTITNGFDEEDFAGLKREKLKSKKFVLCYNGQIYSKDDRFEKEEDCAIVIKAINSLIDAEKVDKNRIQWIISGKIHESIKKLLQSIDKYNIIKFNGYLEHKSSVVMAWNANLLVHYGFYNDITKIGYGGKVFEYLRMKSPILFLSKPGGVFDELSDEIKCGENFAYTDEVGIAGFIFKKYNDWYYGRNDTDIAEQKIYMYERKNLTERLAKVFDKCIGEN